MFRTLLTTAFALTSIDVYAACTNPTAADGGTIFYNTTVNAIQFCDGNNWVNTGLIRPDATGTACTNPTGPEGSMFYNTTVNTIQFCNGDNWVNMGTMRFPNATGTACTNPDYDEGSIFFNTTYKRIQFCNGDDWVNATYFITAQQALEGTQTFKLMASDAQADDYFGYSVAISGNTAIVGAYAEDTGGSSAGAAYIFDATTGNQLHKLMASDAQVNDWFGYSVAISGDTAIVGARLEDTGGSNAGAAYIFDTTTGNQLHKLMAPDAQGGVQFGVSVAVDGNAAIVGAYYEDTGGTDAGAAYIFDATTGNQLYKLLASDAQGTDQFGISVAIDGNAIITGAWGEDTGGNAAGAAYIFK